MTATEILFWILAATVCYAYVGYGPLVIAVGGLTNRLGTEAHPRETCEPSVTLLVAAFNEGAWLIRKIENALGLDYPEEKLRLLVVNDGSDDGSEKILQKFPRVVHLRLPERRGKMAALNRAMRSVDTELVVFSDANVMLNRDAVRKMVPFFRDPAVGCVCGEKRVLAGDANGAADAGEALYWRYESLIKKAEARLGACLGASGELYAIRTALFREEAEDTLVDDFVISMGIALRGYRIQYASGALAMETASTDIAQEFKRKTRIAAGNLQALLRMPGLLNPFRHGTLAFQYISHKFLRSFVVPPSLALLIPLNLFLLDERGMIFILTLVMQGLFYLAAGAGCLIRNRPLPPRLLFIPFYTVFLNLSAMVGLYRYAAGRQPVLWEKALRKDLPPKTEDGGR